MVRILFIGDINNQISEAIKIASEKGAKINLVEDNNSAFKYLQNGLGADLILAPANEKIEDLYNTLQSQHINTKIISYGIGNNKLAAVESIKMGASEYVSFPPSKEIIIAILESISKTDEKIVGESESIRKIIDLCNIVAKSNATILITGESGTGKEVISQYIHSISGRKDNNFVSVNCSAIPENLLESELFGHEKGAFTGAIARRIGKFEESNNGTLLLDEISEMDIKLQAKLLRVLQEKEIERVGGNQKIPLNLRIIATTNRDLNSYINNGHFREDLFFRLNVINLKIPKLKERKRDIKDLAVYFIEKYSKLNNLKPKQLSVNAVKFLEDHDWPGNIRELENTMYRAILLAETSLLEPKDFMLETIINPELKTKNLIISTLDYCAGDRIHAANILGISLEILKKKLDEYAKIS